MAALPALGRPCPTPAPPHRPFPRQFLLINAGLVVCRCDVFLRYTTPLRYRPIPPLPDYLACCSPDIMPSWTLPAVFIYYVSCDISCHFITGVHRCHCYPTVCGCTLPRIPSSCLQLPFPFHLFPYHFLFFLHSTNNISCLFVFTTTFSTHYFATPYCILAVTTIIVT